jgi:outer membrane protein TolC
MRIVFMLPLLLLAAPAAAADLSSVVAAALSRSPALAQTRARKSGAQAAGREAFWSRWPRLSVRGALMRSDDPLYSFGEILQERAVTAADFNPGTLNYPGYRTAAHGTLELGMPLFTGFELTRARKLAGMSADEADSYSASAAQSVRLRATEAFLRDLKDGALLTEIDARITSAQAEIESAERLKKQGLVLGSDHQAALAILSGLKAWRSRALAERAAHQAELAVMVGAAAPDTKGSLSDWYPALEDDAALVSAALAARPELRAADLRKSAAGVRFEGAAQSLLPSVDAFAALDTSADGLTEGATSRLLGVRASLPFGDPAYFSRRARAQADVDASAADRIGIEDAVRGEVLSRAAGLRGLAAVLPDIKESLARARESLEQVRPLYREGRQSVLEVLRAEEAAARLEDSRLETVYHLRSDWAALRRAQGRFDDDAVATLTRSLEAAP